jgi:hypothetical protein
VIRPEVELDVEEAAAWYEAQQPGLGKSFAKRSSRGSIF